MPDGKLQINADCNTGAGTYAADNGTLTMGPIALTKVFCGEQSNDTLFVSQTAKRRHLLFCRWQPDA